MKILDADIETSAAGREGWPEADLPEVAFLGRSNVGKSSLLNALVGRRKLARTSSTPGKTRLLHFFRVRREHDTLRLVDLPGYGFARVAKREQARWGPMIEGYLADRGVLRAVVLLQDARRDPRDEDLDLLAWLAEHEIPAIVALTKVDKLKASERTRTLRTLKEALPVQADWLVATSARTGAGIETLWQRLDTLL